MTAGFDGELRPFPVPALIEGAGGRGGLLDHLRVVRGRVLEGRTAGLATGIAGFDKQTGGLQKGVHILAAPPGAGKTSLALQLSRNAARAGASVVYLAFDESGDRLALKLLCGAAGKSATQYLRGEADPDELVPLIDKHRETTRRVRVYLGTPSIGVDSCAAMLSEAMELDGASEGLMVVDYVQAWAARMKGSVDFRVAVTQLIGELSAAAKSTQCPIIAIAAQNRTGQNSAGMGSLRESSDLEYTADSISFLTDDEAEQSQRQAVRRVTWAVRKNRWGSTFDLPLVFDASLGVFAEPRGPMFR